MQLMKRYELNRKTMNYEVRGVPMGLFFVKLLATLVLFAGFISLFIWLYVDVLKLDLPKTKILKMEKVSLENNMKIVQRQLELYDNTLLGLEERDDHVYRSLFGMDTLEVNKMDIVSDPCARMENIEERVAARSVSLDSIALIASTVGDMASHIPAVPPLLPKKGAFRLSSRFGPRVDPVYGGGAFHEGIDLAAPRGTFVYATADGVVEVSKYGNSAYGNELVINHGFGFKTRYAHLRTIEVIEGMKVRRGDIVATVGSTGKSTGPHLHYEVVYMKKKVNPSYYMDLEMSVEEFRTMVSDRKKDSPYSASKSSSNELLRRRK